MFGSILWILLPTYDTLVFVVYAFCAAVVLCFSFCLFVLLRDQVRRLHIISRIKRCSSKESIMEIKSGGLPFIGHAVQLLLRGKDGSFSSNGNGSGSGSGTTQLAFLGSTPLLRIRDTNVSKFVLNDGRFVRPSVDYWNPLATLLLGGSGSRGAVCSRHLDDHSLEQMLRPFFSDTGLEIAHQRIYDELSDTLEELLYSAGGAGRHGPAAVLNVVNLRQLTAELARRSVTHVAMGFEETPFHMDHELNISQLFDQFTVQSRPYCFASLAFCQRFADGLSGVLCQQMLILKQEIRSRFYAFVNRKMELLQTMERCCSAEARARAFRGQDLDLAACLLLAQDQRSGERLLTTHQVVSELMQLVLMSIQYASHLSTLVLERLALNCTLQSNVRAEIAQHASSQLQILPLLIDKVMESYPLITSVTRVCAADITLPNGIFAPAGTRIDLDLTNADVVDGSVSKTKLVPRFVEQLARMHTEVLVSLLLQRFSLSLPSADAERTDSSSSTDESYECDEPFDDIVLIPAAEKRKRSARQPVLGEMNCAVPFAASSQPQSPVLSA